MFYFDTKWDMTSVADGDAIFILIAGIISVASASHTLSPFVKLSPVKQTSLGKWEACSARCPWHFPRWIDSKVQLLKGDC